MKNRLPIKIFLCLMISTIIFSCKKEIIVKNEVSNDTIQSGFSNKNNEKFDFLPTSTSQQIIVHDNYTLSYVEDKEQAEWVAYELKKNSSHNQNFERPFFIEDVKVGSGSANWKNYKNSGYDKGHLCAAGDMKFSKKAFEETFLTSNIAPQKHDFNEGIWNTLEQKVRYWSSKYDGIYVVTGGVLSGNLKTIGKEKVAVPDYFYKVLLDDSRGEYKMIGFLVPAIDSNKPLYEFVVPVDQIEKMTGIDFYPKLNDAIENKLEKANDYKGWSF
ncbi:DNA/RNA non-specific endonuclease [Flavobacterium sp.]|uniref:DNA/RNA non-specific endonuclease n=1 Tax=Flavobacterium sp. TaxID=239 RepID=UPI003752481B